LADGIINATFKDVDDYQYITGELRASLGYPAPPLP
jgi:hypothetical protein